MVDIVVAEGVTADDIVADDVAANGIAKGDSAHDAGKAAGLVCRERRCCRRRHKKAAWGMTVRAQEGCT